MAEQVREMDKEKRIKLVHDVQRKVLADAPYMFLYIINRYIALRPYVHREFYRSTLQPFVGETIWLEK